MGVILEFLQYAVFPYVEVTGSHARGHGSGQRGGGVVGLRDRAWEGGGTHEGQGQGE